MGMIRPPWVSESWFKKCPFNYCDHFGNQQRLATVCKICQEELERLAKYKKQGKDPYDLRNVFKDLAENFAKTMAMLQKEDFQRDMRDMMFDIETADVSRESVFDRAAKVNIVDKGGDFE